MQMDFLMYVGMTMLNTFILFFFFKCITDNLDFELSTSLSQSFYE